LLADDSSVIVPVRLVVPERVGTGHQRLEVVATGQSAISPLFATAPGEVVRARFA
jgi:hypothetical protein